jgi:hypothetical protein
MDFHFSCTFVPYGSNLCTLHLSGSCSKQSGHIEASSDEEQLNGKGQRSRYESSKMAFSRLRAQSEVVPNTGDIYFIFIFVYLLL